MTIEDRGRVGGGTIEEDDLEFVTIPDRRSKAGDKQTTANKTMFTFKSELQSLIGNLQETT